MRETEEEREERKRVAVEEENRWERVERRGEERYLQSSEW